MDRPLPSDTTAPHSRNVLTMQKKIGMWGGEGVHDKRYRYRYGHACEFTSALERPSLAGASDSEICVLVAHKLWELKKKN